MVSAVLPIMVLTSGINDLPYNVQHCETISSFKNKLKTHLFSLSTTTTLEQLKPDPSPVQVHASVCVCVCVYVTMNMCACVCVSALGCLCSTSSIILLICLLLYNAIDFCDSVSVLYKFIKFILYCFLF